MAGSAIERALEAMERQGFVDAVLPFLLVFTLMYAILQKTHVLGSDSKKYNVVVSFVVSLLFVIPHVTNRYPADSDPVLILNNALPQVSLVLIAIIFLLVMVGILGGDSSGSLAKYSVYFSIAVIVLIFGGAAGWWDGKLEQALVSFFGPDALAIVVMLLAFGLMMWFITGGETKKSKEEEKKTKGQHE